MNGGKRLGSSFGWGTGWAKRWRQGEGGGGGDETGRGGPGGGDFFRGTKGQVSRGGKLGTPLKRGPPKRQKPLGQTFWGQGLTGGAVPQKKGLFWGRGGGQRGGKKVVLGALIGRKP